MDSTKVTIQTDNQIIVYTLGVATHEIENDVVCITGVIKDSQRFILKGVTNEV